MMPGHCDPQLGNGGGPIREEARSERSICPGLGYNASAILWYPLLLGKLVQFLNRCRRVHSTRIERGLYRFNALFRRGCGVYDAIAHLTFPCDLAQIPAIRSLMRTLITVK